MCRSDELARCDVLGLVGGVLAAGGLPGGVGDPVNAIERLRDLSEQAQWKCSEDPSCPDCAADTEAVAAVDALYQAAKAAAEAGYHIAECGDHPDHLLAAENACRALAAAVRRIEGTP